MARVRPAQTPTPDQLTLDDWAEILNANRDAAEAPGREATSVNAPASVASTEASDGAACISAEGPGKQATQHHPVATDLLETPGALLTRSHLRALGLERRAIDAVFRKLSVVALPGYSRPMIHVDEYLELIDKHTYREDRVRPAHA